MNPHATACHAIVGAAVGRVELARFDLPPPGPGQVLIRSAYTGISPGTELRCLAGRQTTRDAFPYVAGYQCAGVIESVGEGVGLPIGQPVFCTGSLDTGPYTRRWGGHVSCALADASKLVRLDERVDLIEASILKLAAIALHGVRLAAPLRGQTVAVVGLGVLGQVCARLYASMGCDVLAADRNPTRVAAAQRAGIAALVADRPLALVFGSLRPQGSDIVVDVTGAEPVLAQSIGLVRVLPWSDDRPTGGKLVIQGSYAGCPAMDVGQAFDREATILVPRDHVAADLHDAAAMLAAGSLKLRDLITAVHPPSLAQHAYDALAAPDSDALTFCFDWNSATAV